MAHLLDLRVLAFAAAVMSALPAPAQSQSLCAARVGQTGSLNDSLNIIALELGQCRRGDHVRIHADEAEVTAVVSHFCDFDKAIIANQTPAARLSSGTVVAAASFVACIYVGRRVAAR